MGSPPASLWPTPPLCDYERGFAPQREQRLESDRPSADTETCMLVGLRRSLASGEGMAVQSGDPRGDVRFIRAASDQRAGETMFVLTNEEA